MKRYVAAVALASALLCTTFYPHEAASGEAGVVVPRSIQYGDYFEYVPSRTIMGILVVAHGSVEEEKSAQDVRKVAETFARRWTRFAQDHGLIVLAPVFGRDFGSWIGEPGIALGGYRGLEGRQIGADEFVERIVDEYSGRGGGDKRFYLYGHSAGGQFAGRYAIRHPDRVKALILSAPGRYAFPDPDAPWPYGQKQVSIKAGATAQPRIIQPDRENWRRVAALPIAVVVGTADLEVQPPRKDHAGSTRVDYARNWVEAMTRIAPQGKSRIRVIEVPGIGHSSAGLTPACQSALAQLL